MAARVIDGIKGLRAHAGEHIGYTDWMEVTQDQVNQFADATGDHQWIHVDVERAKQGPFGGPIAHGFLTLSLIPTVLQQVVELRGFAMGVNYGLEKVRFPAPVPVGSKVRGGVTIDEVTEVAGGVQVAQTITFEIDGADKPACAAVFLSRHYV